MEERTIEIVDKEINYLESSYKLRFKSAEGLANGLKFLDETINEWTNNGAITHRKATLDINNDEYWVGVTMRIEGDVEEDEIEDINI